MRYFPNIITEINNLENLLHCYFRAKSWGRHYLHNHVIPYHSKFFIYLLFKAKFVLLGPSEVQRENERGIIRGGINCCLRVPVSPCNLGDFWRSNLEQKPIKISQTWHNFG